MKNLFLVLYFLFATLLFAEDDSEYPMALGDAGYALATLEGDPHALIHNCVNVITGDYVDLQADIVLPGVEPILFQRFYCSSHQDFGDFNFAWAFNHFVKIEDGNPMNDPPSCKVNLHDSHGAFIPFEEGQDYLVVNRDCLSKRVTNVPYGTGGRGLLKNRRLHVHYKEMELINGMGEKYYFPNVRRYSETHGMLRRILKPNRHQIEYSYDEYTPSPNAIEHPYIKQIKASTNKDVFLNALNFSLLKKGKAQRTLVASHGKRTLAKYHYERSKYYRYDKELKEWEPEWQWTLKEVKREQMPREKYFYDSLRTHHPEPKKIMRKERPDGRFLEIEYFRKGNNFIWPGQNCVIEGLRVGRVMHLKAPAGPSGETIPIYRFLYDPSPEGRRTEVYDAKDHRKIYHYNAEERLTKIETYTGNAPFQKFCEERFTWGFPGTKDCGNLDSKVFVDAEGQPLLCNQYAYDENGNLAEEILCGNLTGIEQPALEVDAQGRAKENGADRLYVGHLYTQDGLNLVKYENCADKEHNVEYLYLPGTNLLAARFTIEGNKIRIREFFEYDDLGALAKEIIDNGDDYSKHNLHNVTERRIRIITNSSSFPVGLAKTIEEKYLEGGQEKLLRLLENCYDKEGHLKEQKCFDSNRNHLYTLTWKYNNLGKVIEEKNALGHVIRRKYDKNGNLEEEEGPQPDKKQIFFYDKMNRLVQKEISGNGVHLTESYRYDTLGNKESSTDIYGQQTLYEYDDFGRPCKIIHPCVQNEKGETISPVTIKTYDYFGNVTSITDPCGYVTRAKYTVRGQPYHIFYPDGTEEKFEYTLKGQLSKKIASNGTYTTYAYDYLARPIRKECFSSSGVSLALETKTYNAFHLLEETNPEGLTTLYSYDGAGRLVTQSQKEDQEERLQKIYLYDSEGFIKETREFFGSGPLDYIATHRRYDHLGQVREESVRDAAGILQSHTCHAYDEAGNCVETLSSHEEGLVATTTHYNAINRPLFIKDPLGHVTTYHYDFSAHKEETVDPKGNTTQTFFDALGRPIEVLCKNQSGGILKKTQYRYDLVGNCRYSDETVITPNAPDRHVCTYKEYDAMQRVILSIDAYGEKEQKAIKYHYNVYGQLETLLKPDGIKLLYTYDAQGLLKTFSASDESFHYTYTYNQNGQPVLVENERQGQTIKKYDPFGNLEKETLANGLCVQYKYDYLERPVAIILPDHSSIHYTYQAYRLHSVARRNSEGILLYDHLYTDHNLLGAPIKEKLPNQLGDKFNAYNVKGAPRRIETTYFKEEIEERDSLDHLLRRTVTDPLGIFACQYDYDDLHQLTKETGAFSHTFVNDSLFNAICKNDQPHIHNALNQLLQDKQSVYAHDLNGNRTTLLRDGDVTNYEYDAQDRLTSVVQEGQKVIYTYDEENQRLSKKHYVLDNGQWKEIKSLLFFYAGMEELGSWSDQGIHELCVRGREKAVALELQGEVYIPIQDHLGHTCCLLDASGNPVEIYRWSAFGEGQIFDAAHERQKHSINPWRYSGKRHDEESGLIYFGMRYYDPLASTWITSDPIGQQGGPNLYAYVLRNPLKYHERFGLNPEVDAWLSYEADQLRQDIDRRDYDQRNMSRRFCGAAHGTMDFVVDAFHSWETGAAYMGLSETEFSLEDKMQIIGGLEEEQVSRMETLDGWVRDSFSINKADPIYNSYRSNSKMGMEIGSLAAGAFGLVKGILRKVTTQTAKVVKLNSKLKWPSPSNGRCVINGIEYTTHALERMAPRGLIQSGTEIISRGVPPSVVENAINFGTKTIGNTSQEVVHIYGNVRVVTNLDATRVITVITTGR